MKTIKKFIPEIIAVVAIILLMVGYGIATKKLHSNSVYDGNYVGGNATDAYADMDVKWIASVQEAPGVNKVEFAEESEFKSYEEEAILEEEGWYWLSFVAQINDESGYHEIIHSDLIVTEEWTGDSEDIFVLTVSDGVGYVSKVPNNVEEMLVYCEVYFSNNGCVFNAADFYSSASLYLEKNGNLTAYNLQIVQVCMMAAVAVIGIIYIIFAFFKNKLIHMAAMLVLLCIPFGISVSEFRGNDICEWRAVDDEDLFVIVPKHLKDKRVQISGDVTLVNEMDLDREYFEDFQPEIDIDSKDFKEDYKRFDVIPGYGVYPFIFVVDVLCAIAFGTVLIINKSRGTTITPDGTTEDGWAEFYGRYVVGKVKYLSDAFAGMEAYFEQNESNEEILFISTEYSYDGEVIESPEYAVEKVKKAPYPGAPVDKRHIIKVVGGEEPLDYELNFGKKNAYLIKYMEGVITIVYEIRKKEG